MIDRRQQSTWVFVTLFSWAVAPLFGQSPTAIDKFGELEASIEEDLKVQDALLKEKFFKENGFTEAEQKAFSEYVEKTLADASNASPPALTMKRFVQLILSKDTFTAIEISQIDDDQLSVQMCDIIVRWLSVAKAEQEMIMLNNAYQAAASPVVQLWDRYEPEQIRDRELFRMARGAIEDFYRQSHDCLADNARIQVKLKGLIKDHPVPFGPSVAAHGTKDLAVSLGASGHEAIRLAALNPKHPHQAIAAAKLRIWFGKSLQGQKDSDGFPNAAFVPLDEALPLHTHQDALRMMSSIDRLTREHLVSAILESDDFTLIKPLACDFAKKRRVEARTKALTSELGADPKSVWKREELGRQQAALARIVLGLPKFRTELDPHQLLSDAVENLTIASEQLADASEWERALAGSMRLEVLRILSFQNEHKLMDADSIDIEQKLMEAEFPIPVTPEAIESLLGDTKNQRAIDAAKLHQSNALKFADLLAKHDLYEEAKRIYDKLPLETANNPSPPRIATQACTDRNYQACEMFKLIVQKARSGYDTAVQNSSFWGLSRSQRLTHCHEILRNMIALLRKESQRMNPLNDDQKEAVLVGLKELAEMLPQQRSLPAMKPATDTRSDSEKAEDLRRALLQHKRNGRVAAEKRRHRFRRLIDDDFYSGRSTESSQSFEAQQWRMREGIRGYGP